MGRGPHSNSPQDLSVSDQAGWLQLLANHRERLRYFLGSVLRLGSVATAVAGPRCSTECEVVDCMGAAGCWP